MSNTPSKPPKKKIINLPLKILSLLIIIVSGIYAFDIDTAVSDALSDNISEITSEIENSDGSFNQIKKQTNNESNRDTTDKTNSSNSSVSSNADSELSAQIERVLPQKGKLSVIALDVGQADSIFIKSPSGKTMLVDAGDIDSYEAIDVYLTQAGIKKIDVLVATHPHSDHIGSMKRVIENYEIGSIYMPKAEHTTKTYSNLLLAIKDKGLKINTAKGGATKTIPFDNDIVVSIFSPMAEKYDNLNNYSIVLKITYGKNSILLTGDIEREIEKDILKKIPNDLLKSDVLKVAHHGSTTSSTPDFLKAVAPTYAFISLGTDNSYGHPHDKIVKRLNDLDIKFYQTNLNGYLAFFSDSEKYNIVTSKK